ncbi:carboxypeptidase-like regulatory domain-containing protein, partial [Arthrospira platensis SPKY1]|nr:carboxypeptidase-like regulatory domain-containing protein [Arthrospira platensis SPKY1]
GVNVFETGTLSGTVTDLDGSFSLDAEMGSTLVFSYIGMKSKEVVVESAFMRIEMEDEASSLDEVVVVGYGVQKRRDVTGAVVSIGEKTFENRPAPNIIQSLQGTVA